jgi:hypothetical protein
VKSPVTKDFGLEQQRSMQKYKLGSLGFNALWDCQRATFSLSFDAHKHHDREPAQRPGDRRRLDLREHRRHQQLHRGPACGGSWVQEMWFNNSLPIGRRPGTRATADALAGTNGVTNPGFVEGEIGSQVLRINAQTQDSEIKQAAWTASGASTTAASSSEWMIPRLPPSTGCKRDRGLFHPRATGAWPTWIRMSPGGLMGLIRPIDLVGLFDD